MDDALTVTNLVYVGTLIIGGAFLVLLAGATVVTLMIAGAGQGVASIIAAAVRALRRIGKEPVALGQTERAEYESRAVVAKADAILAARRAAATASSARASAQAAEASAEPAAGSEDAEPADEEVALPAARTAAPAASTVVTPMRPARQAPSRPGPPTGTQPVLVGRAS